MKRIQSAIHPGKHLAEILAKHGLLAAEFARAIRVPTNRITRIINGQRSISADTALRIAHYFGTKPEAWMQLQARHDLAITQRKISRELRSLPTLKQKR